MKTTNVKERYIKNCAKYNYLKDKWISINPPNNFEGRQNGMAISIDDEIFLVGGQTYDCPIITHRWYSPDHNTKLVDKIHSFKISDINRWTSYGTSGLPNENFVACAKIGTRKYSNSIDKLVLIYVKGDHSNLKFYMRNDNKSSIIWECVHNINLLTEKDHESGIIINHSIVQDHITDNLYIGYGGYIYCVDIINGNVIKQLDVDDSTWIYTLSIDCFSRKLYVRSDLYFYIFDINTLTRLYRTTLEENEHQMKYYY